MGVGVERCINTSTFWPHFWCREDTLGHILKRWWVHKKTRCQTYQLTLLGGLVDTPNTSRNTSNVPTFQHESMSEICVCVFILSLPAFWSLWISDCETCTHPCIAIQWSLVGKLRGQGLAQDYGLVPGHGLVLEISGYLIKSVIFHNL